MKPRPPSALYLALKEWYEETRGDDTQKEWIKRVGIKQSTVSEIENGERRVALSHIIKIMEKLGIGVPELCRGLERIAKRQASERRPDRSESKAADNPMKP